MTTNQIVRELGIQESDDAFKARIVSTVMATADLRFARVVDEIMTDEERQEFEEFAHGREPQDIAKWVNEKYNGVGDMYTSIVKLIVMDLKNKNQ